MSDTSWLYGSDSGAPESEALQSEREIFEDIARTLPVRRSQATAEAALQARVASRDRGRGALGLDGRVATAGRDQCDNCHQVDADLSYNEATGLSLCEGCDQVATSAIEAPAATATWKRLRNGAWGLSGPSALLQPGARVTVVKRNGDEQTVTVGRVLWSDNNKALATKR